MFVIRYKKIFLSVSALLILAGIVSISVFGFRPGTDFTGGVLWRLSFEEPVVKDEVVSVLVNAGAVDVSAFEDLSKEGLLLIKMKELSEDQKPAFEALLEDSVGPFEELRFEFIGPTVGEELRSRAIWAVILVLIAVSLYIAFAFRKVSYPISSWKYGIVTLITLFHDVIIPAGILAFLGHLNGIELDSNFVVAILFIMGFSVHDTIVVFDRIRENIGHMKKGDIFEEKVGESISQTLVRSINTSLTLVVVLLALLFFGAVSLNFFVLIVLIGTLVGTYSSICVASPLLTLWHKFGKSN